MNSLPRVKERARVLRSSVLERSDNLFDGLIGTLTDLGFTVKPVSKAVINKAEAIFSAADKTIRYDKELDNEPQKRLLVIAHEAGHIHLHASRLDDELKGVDALSPYFNTAGPSLARYNRRSREEIEADAFANEFVCPSAEAFAKWNSDLTATSDTLGNEYGVSAGMMASRLAEALFEETLTATAESQSKEAKKREDDANQTEAAQHTGSPALINAGPGTGKTATLIMRVKHLLGDLRADPVNLLILTFSNEAAEELRARIEAEFGVERAEQIEITTFHGFGHAALLDWESDLDKEFIILDESRQEELVFGILGSADCEAIMNFRDPLETARNCVRQITKLKERRIGVDEVDARINKWEKEQPEKTTAHSKARAFLDVFREYEKVKSEQGAVDFPDLINLPLYILESKPELVEALRKKHLWVMVDEYQDVSRSVAHLLTKICGPDNPPWVVGDLRQAIYVFCGASPENVIKFTTDFPNATVFELQTNYRSCDEVIELANQFADVMRHPEKDVPDFEAIWSRGSSELRLPGEDAVIKLARAGSDPAEYDGVAAQVTTWLQTVDPHEIAVLSRRNKDVRKICVELSKRGIRVATPGLISTDGAAGLMACISSLMDSPWASLPRVVYSLGAESVERAALDRTIEILTSDEKERDLSGESASVVGLIEEIDRLEETLEPLRYSGDAFGVMCAFLFDGSDYLRRVLASENDAGRAMLISEILSALAWAVSYRYSHPDVSPRKSRIGFAQFFRGILAAGRPALAPPSAIEGSVQVMTCHASKGLEFPCVAVTGQTVSLAKPTSWLPPGIDSVEEEKEQADALLFVGATRAKRSLLVSFAQTAQRNPPKLLENWIKKHSVTPTIWASDSFSSDSFLMDATWGLKPRGKRIAAGSLEKDWCGMKVYTQDIYGGKFRPLEDPLYPAFFVVTRQAMTDIMARHAEGGGVSPEEAAAIFTGHFEEEKRVTHPLYSLYSRRGISYAVGFAKSVANIPKQVKILDADEEFGGNTADELLALRFGLTAYYVDGSGAANAVLFRPESMNVDPGTQEINWSKLKARSTTPLVLLRERDKGLAVWIYSGEDAAIYRFKWNTKPENMTAAAEKAQARREAFSAGKFDGKAEDFRCENQCENRTNCSYWLRAGFFPDEQN